MNIKNLRRNYDAMTMKERLILLDQAEARDDESEIKAIVSASPKQNFRICDFVESREGLMKLRLVNLIQRLHRQRNFMFFLLNADKETESGFFDCASFEAYLDEIDLQVEKAIFDELGINHEVWKEREAELFDIGIESQMISDLMRQMAFDETEAQKFMVQKANEKGLPFDKLNYTFEKRLETIKDILANGDLARLYKG